MILKFYENGDVLRQDDQLRKLYNTDCIYLFTMKGCPHCQKMKRSWNSFVKDHKNSINILEIERSLIPEFMRSHSKLLLPTLQHVHAFPTILKKTKAVPSVTVFTDDRKKSKFIEFMQS